MWSSTIAAAWSKVQMYAVAACQAPDDGPVDPVKLETMILALAETEGFSQQHPPLLGVCGTARLEGPDGHTRKEPVVWLLTGRVRLAAAKQLGLAVPIFPLDPEAAAAGVDAGLLDPETYQVKDDLALAALWAGGSFGLAGELLGAREPEIETPTPEPAPEPEADIHVDKASDDAEETP